MERIDKEITEVTLKDLLPGEVVKRLSEEELATAVITLISKREENTICAIVQSSYENDLKEKKDPLIREFTLGQDNTPAPMSG